MQFSGYSYWLKFSPRNIDIKWINYVWVIFKWDWNNVWNVIGIKNYQKSAPSSVVLKHSETIKRVHNDGQLIICVAIRVRLIHSISFF